MTADIYAMSQEIIELQSRVAELEAHLRKTGVSPGRDFEDVATDAEDDEVLQALDDSGRQELNDIQDALSRMDAGTYGICQRTGNRIPLRRLQAMPTALYTVPGGEDDTN